MKTILIAFCTILSLWILCGTSAKAQDKYNGTKTEAEKLTTLKENVIQEEKDSLKSEVEKINLRLNNHSITEEEAQGLKKNAAEKHALNIENRVAIIDNKIALLQRNGELDEEEPEGYFSISVGNEDADNTRIFGVSVKSKKKDVVYDRRTTSGAFIAVGLNNLITKGESLENSDFKVGGSRFTELGWTWKTRVFKNSNWLRVKYGFAFQFNGLKPIENHYFVDTGEETELQTYPLHLKKSKFRMDNLVVPIHFEFGPSKKIEHDDYFRYSTDSQFKIGLGGYAGVNLGARQKLKYKEDGESQKQKSKADYNTNNFIYGVSAYVGWGAGSVYVKYDLNTLFKNNQVDQRNVSLGLRLDLD